jgi:hypothetical protein
MRYAPILCALVVSLLSMNANALSQTGNVTVTQMNVYLGSDATGVLVQFTPSVANNPEGCSYSTGNQVWIDFSAAVNPSGRDLYAAVLAGFIAQQTLSFQVSGCSSNGRPLVNEVVVY